MKLADLVPGFRSLRGVRQLQRTQRLRVENLEPRRLLSATSLDVAAWLEAARQTLADAPVTAGTVADTYSVNGSGAGIDVAKVTGMKWHDVNGDGVRGSDEPGLAGVVIYADLNQNRERDPGEPFTRSRSDHPDTLANEMGTYVLEDLPVGELAIREVVPDGFVQTFPHDIIPPAPEPGLPPLPPLFGGHHVFLEAGDVVDGLDFGNQQVQPASIHGMKWLDENGNGEREATEPGLAGVVIYADLNFDGRLDSDEPHTITMEDNPDTNVNERGRYWLRGLPPGFYAIREVVPDHFLQTFPRGDTPFPSEPQLPPHTEDFAHFVFVGSGQVVEEINFGNRPVNTTLSVHGRKWLDANANGEQDANEPGLAGVVIYSDRNLNAMLDPGEPRTRTSEDIPETDFDETGLYWLAGLDVGPHLIREVVPDGFEQTFPAVAPHAGGPFPGSGGHFVVLAAGGGADGLDFGNRPLEPPRGSVHGTKWLDENGNQQRDADEPGLPGVTIYSDLNFNGAFDRDEPHTLTMQDNPDTDFDESGLYWLELTAGPHMIREVVPAGFVQTFPVSDATVPNPDPGGYFVLVPAGGAAAGLDFGNRRVTTDGSSVHGRKWLDANGDGLPNDREPGLPGVVIYSDRNSNGVLDRDEPHTVTMRDIPETDFDEAGLYWLDNLGPGRHVIREVVPEGFVQTFPRTLSGTPLESGAHFVELAPGQGVDGKDFGNQRTDFSADFDQDGAIDGADFLTWQASFPIDSGALHSDGDANGDGDVDGRDFLIWQRQFHSPNPPLEAALADSPGILRLSVRDAAFVGYAGRLPQRSHRAADMDFRGLFERAL